MCLEVGEAWEWSEREGVKGGVTAAVGVMRDERGPLVGVRDEVGASGVCEEVEGGGEECGVVDDVLCVEACGEDGAGATAEVIDELRELCLEVAHELREVHEGSADDEVEVVGEEDEGKDVDIEACLRGGEEL